MVSQSKRLEVVLMKTWCLAISMLEQIFDKFKFFGLYQTY